MSFEPVLAELEFMSQAFEHAHSRDNIEVCKSQSHLTEADIQRWVACDGLVRCKLYDCIALWLARGFHDSKLRFEFCDGIINSLFLIITSAREDLPSLFWDVFLAFDAGEFFRDNDRSRDPVEEYTRPAISKVIEETSSAGEEGRY